MLAIGVPNIEMHIYGNGRHPGDPLPDGSRMSGGLTDRNGTPYGTWQYRRNPAWRPTDKDIAVYLSQPPPAVRQEPSTRQ